MDGAPVLKVRARETPAAEMIVTRRGSPAILRRARSVMRSFGDFLDFKACAECVA